MAIVGPLVLRVNLYNSETNEFHSPYKTSYVWDKNGYMISECLYCTDKDEDGLPLIGEYCTCGIYGSLNKEVVDTYANKPNAVWFLVEGLGRFENVWMHTEGFRAAAGLLVALVNMSHPDQKQSIKTNGGEIFISPQAETILIAREHFNLPILPKDKARDIAIKQWEKYGMRWKSSFF